MDIIFYTNNSEKNKLDKSVDEIIRLNGTLKQGTSIVNPTITIEGDISLFNTANYMSIPDFGRKYFITDITSVTNSLIEISAHCDVLSSFASAIRSNKAIIKKSENNWNTYLDDGTFKVYSNEMVVQKKFPQGFTTNEFVLAIAGS